MGLFVGSCVGDDTYIGSATYTALGQADLMTFGNTLRTDYVYYTADNRLEKIKTGTEASPTSLQYLTYDYDSVGNVGVITDTLASETLNFAYDHLDRMIEVTEAITRTYAYDEIGNITDFNGTSYTYGDEDHVHAVTSAGSGTYSYDANGNMTLRATGGVTQTLDYDHENRLTEVDDGTNTVTFAYDGNGQRVKKVENGVTTIYIGNYYEVYDPGGPNEEVTKYYYASGQRIAMRQGDALYWIHGDHLGSTAITTDDSGVKESELRYYPYGSDRYSWETTPTAYKFTGQMLDESTGLYFYKARYYDPSLGRFIQADTIVPDPMNSQQLNRYSYVNNNPLRYIDPSGHCAPDDQACWELLWYAQNVFSIPTSQLQGLQTPPPPTPTPEPVPLPLPVKDVGVEPATPQPIVPPEVVPTEVREGTPLPTEEPPIFFVDRDQITYPEDYASLEPLFSSSELYAMADFLEATSDAMEQSGFAIAMAVAVPVLSEGTIPPHVGYAMGEFTIVSLEATAFFLRLEGDLLVAQGY